MFILVIGGPVEGFQFVGPFEESEDAIKHAEDVQSESWWVAEVTAPAPQAAT